MGSPFSQKKEAASTELKREMERDERRLEAEEDVGWRWLECWGRDVMGLGLSAFVRLASVRDGNWR